MKSSRNEQTRRAHYRDRHISLSGLPAQSTEHGFRTRVKKTSNEDLRLQAHQQPMIGVFSILDGSVQGETPDDPAQEERNRQRKKGRTPANAPMAARAPPSAGSFPLQVQIGPPVPTNRHARVAAPVPAHDMYYGPLSPSSDNTPVSATDPLQYQFQNPYPMSPSNAFGQHFPTGGVQVQGMGFPGSAPHNNLTFDHEYQIPLADVGPYHSGLMTSDDPSQFSYVFDGYTPHEHAYYPHEHVSSEYCSGPYPEAQLTNPNPNGHVMTTSNYIGSSAYPHSNGQYDFYPPNNFGQ